MIEQMIELKRKLARQREQMIVQQRTEAREISQQHVLKRLNDLQHLLGRSGYLF